MATPNYKRSVGRIATDRFDFEDHLKGQDPTNSSIVTSFRHKASHVDIDNPSLVYGNGSNVEEALEDIKTFVTAFSNTGQGFITIGDGYDTYKDANTIVNFDPTIPSLDTVLNPLFIAINDGYDGYQMLDSYTRVQYGGIIVIKAGTYIVKDTINVPPGITLMGEGYGTKIINATGLTIPAAGIAPYVKSTYIISNITATSPIQVTTSVANTIETGDKVVIGSVDGLTGADGVYTVTVINNTNFTLNNSSGSGVWGGHGSVKFARPVFKILPDLNRSFNDSAVDPNLFVFSKSTKIMNMVIADNFVENTVLTDLFYKLPQNKSGEGVILQETGSNLELLNVYLIGRANFSSGTIISQATSIGIKLDTSNGLTTGTYLKLNDCFIDGFSQPIQFYSDSGVKDHLEIQNCKIRSHGYYLGNGTDNISNCFVATNDNNVLISGNTLYGNHNLCVTILYIDDVLVSTPDVNARSRMLVANNNFVITRSGATQLTPVPYYVKPAVLGAFASNAFIMAYGNSYDTIHGFNVSVSGDADPRLNLQSTTALIAAPTTTIGNDSSTIVLNGGISKTRMVIITTATYAVDVTSGVPDYILLVPTTNIFNTVGTTTITLPAVTNGRILIIKDIENDTTAYTVTAQATQLIEKPDGTGFANSISLSTNGGSYVFCGVVDTINVLNKWVLLSKNGIL